MEPLATWPPTYNLRLSLKAKHAHIKVIPNLGLEVVIPKRLQKHIVIADLLQEKRAWIEKHLAKLTIIPLKHIYTLNLQAINQSWDISYEQRMVAKLSSLELPNNKLVIRGDVANIENTHKYLQKWLKAKARVYLLPWLNTLSTQYALPYNKISIRGQQTLWGSCTSSKNISLNYKLLLLPQELTTHIMLHELCHTKHLNHSHRFWNLLYNLDTKTDEHDKAIRHGDKYIPRGL